jgi:hypothetical protein
MAMTKIESIQFPNLNVILAVHAPGHMITGPKWKLALYLDERSNNDQKDALTKIFTGQVGGELFVEILPRIGEKLGIRSVPVDFSISETNKRKIKVPSFAEMEMEGSTGKDPNIELKVVNPAFSNTPAIDPIIARSTRHTYRDYGLEWGNSGKNAYCCSFAYVPQMEHFIVITQDSKHHRLELSLSSSGIILRSPDLLVMELLNGFKKLLKMLDNFLHEYSSLRCPEGILN